jgi:hypothetical protein
LKRINKNSTASWSICLFFLQTVVQDGWVNHQDQEEIKWLISGWLNKTLIKFQNAKSVITKFL